MFCLSLLRVTSSLPPELLKQARPDLLPGDDIGGILLMPLDAVIEFRALRVRQRQCVGFQAFPHHIQQILLFRRRRDFLFRVANRSLVCHPSAVSPLWPGAFLRAKHLLGTSGYVPSVPGIFPGLSASHTSAKSANVCGTPAMIKNRTYSLLETSFQPSASTTIDR